MIEAVEEWIEYFENIDEVVNDLVMSLLRDREKLIIQLNVDQLYSGIDNDGDKITPPYKPSTVKRKRRKGQPVDRVTTRDKGDHHESIFVKYGNNEFELDAEDFKKQYLVRKYGNKLYGLTEDSIEKISNDMRDELIELLKSKML